MNRNWTARIATLAALIIVLVASVTASARARTAQTEKPSPSAANASDVASMDSIVAALYDVISGPAGKKRDWDRMRSLFIPGARLIPTGKRQSGEIASRVL